MNINEFNKSMPISIGKSHNPLLSFKNEINNALNGFYQSLDLTPFTSTTFDDLLISPSTDIVEDENNFKVEIEMPGMGEKDIHVAIKDGILNIKGEKKTSKKDKGLNYITREISYGCYERNIMLPESANVEKATASFKKGMLWVTIPKKEGTNLTEQEIKVVKVSE